MKLREQHRVSLVDAEQRALALLTRDPTPAATIADKIWPNNGMTGQGAGAAASRILKRLEKRGLVAHAGRGWVRLERTPSPDLFTSPP